MNSGSSSGRVAAWASWSWGSAAFNTVVAMFIFTPYLTGRVAAGLPDGLRGSLVGWAMALGGVLIFLLAPATGVWADTPHRRRRALATLTAMVVLLTAAATFVREDVRYLWFGLALYCAGSVFNELATVPYNGMLRQLSTRENAARISGFGWAAGYVGGVAVLLLCYLCFMSGDGQTRGLAGVPVADGVNVRASVATAAVWFALFALPILLSKPIVDPSGLPARSPRLTAVYRELWRDLVEQWRLDRTVVYYLLASAIFRDGLVATFGLTSTVAVLVFGLSASATLLFGVAANIVAAVGAVIGGLADTRIGSKRLIVVSLASIVAFGVAMMCFSAQSAFWICGLAIALFVGPAQSGARTLMLRMAPVGREAFVFGLFTMTGQAVSFIGPCLFAAFAWIFHTTRAGIAGLVLMIGLGMVALLFVRVPQRHQKLSAAS